MGGTGFCASAAAGSTKPRGRCARSTGYADRVRMRTRSGPIASTDSIAWSVSRVTNGRSSAVFREATTSFEVTGEPSAKRRPFLSEKTNVRSSGFSHRSAIAASAFRIRSRRTSPSKTFALTSSVNDSLMIGAFGKIPVTSERTASVSVSSLDDRGERPHPAASAVQRIAEKAAAPARRPRRARDRAASGLAPRRFTLCRLWAGFHLAAGGESGGDVGPTPVGAVHLLVEGAPRRGLEPAREALQRGAEGGGLAERGLPHGV